MRSSSQSEALPRIDMREDDPLRLVSDLAPTGWTGRRAALGWGALGVLGLAVATCYALLVAPGLPYDEPSHWGYVQWLALHGSLPVIGNRSVGYEAQMGPVAYLMPALATWGWRTAGGSPATALYVARMCGLVPLIGLFAIVFGLVRRVAPSSTTGTVVTSVAVAVLNPMVLAMSMSVQNDTAALALTCLLVLLVLRSADVPSMRRSVLLGVLGGLAAGARHPS